MCWCSNPSRSMSWTGSNGSHARPALTRACSRSPTSSPPAAWAWPHWTSSGTATPRRGSRTTRRRCTCRPMSTGRGTRWRTTRSWPVAGTPSKSYPRGRWVVRWRTSTGPGGSPTPAPPAPPRRSWPSTTGSTSPPTTEPPSSPSWRCSPSSPGPTTTCGPSPSWPWWSRCSRPPTSRRRRVCSRRTGAISPSPAWPPGWPTPCAGGPSAPGSIDFLRIDWFDYAPLPVDEVRRHFGVAPQSHRAVEQGSVGPWEPGGISPFQWEAGRALAGSRGRRYDSFGASC